MAVRARQPPPALRLVRPYFVRISSARVTNTQLSALIRLGWVAISNGKEGAGAHDPTPPACHIIHVRTSELNKVFTVGEATLVPSESSARSPIRRDRREIALINGYHPTHINQCAT